MNDPMLPAAVEPLRKYWDDKARAESDDTSRVEQNRRPQLMRFEAFLIHHDLTGKSLLDVGCGTGELLAHVRRRRIACRYRGVDLSEQMIHRCRERFPGEDFAAENILDGTAAQEYDYTISIGIHNVRVDGGRELLEQVTRRQFEMCRVAAHISILTDRYQGFAPHIQPWKAEEVVAMALSITPYVVLRHDYLPNDMGLTLYREPLIDTRKDLLLD